MHNDNVPVRLVIWFVGVIAVLSLGVAAWLFWLGRGGEGVLAITNGCVMGLLALLGQTRTGHRKDDVPVPVKADDPLPVQEVGQEVKRDD